MKTPRKARLELMELLSSSARIARGHQRTHLQTPTILQHHASRELLRVASAGDEGILRTPFSQGHARFLDQDALPLESRR